MHNEIPVRTGRVRYAESYLYDDYNDVDFFIEDTDSNTKKIILKLLQRAFSEEIKISQIFPLGGRENVLSQYDQRDTERKQIYIIDGDLYLFFTNEPYREGLVIFNKYCIENYLFNEKAIYEVLYDECATECNYDSMCQSFQFSTWWKLQKKYLYRLFLEYAIEKEHNLGLTTVKYSIYRLLDSNHYELNKDLVLERIIDLRKEIKNSISKEQYNQSRIGIISNIKSKSISPESCISGKDYILPILFQKIKKYAHSSLPDSHFKYRLSKICDVTEIKEVISPHL